MPMNRNPRATRWPALLGAAFVAIACGESGDTSPPAASSEQPAPPSEPPAAPPAAEVADTGFIADADRGAGSYATYCASCHGPRGNADGPAAASLNPPPARHSDAAYMDALSDEYLFRVIQEGGAAVGKSPLMAPWSGVLSDHQIRDVVAFIRELARD